MNKLPYKYLDNPNSKTVTVVFEDNSTVILNSLSYDNYTNPPGYKVKNPTPQEVDNIRKSMSVRVETYRSELRKQMNLT
jgi:hypothetical protein